MLEQVLGEKEVVEGEDSVEVEEVALVMEMVQLEVGDMAEVQLKQMQVPRLLTLPYHLNFSII